MGTHAHEPPGVSIEPLGAYTLARVATDIDAHTHQDIDDALTAALADTSTALIIDLARVDDLNSQGLNTLARLHNQATGRGISIVLTGVHGNVTQGLTITRLDTYIPIRPDTETAQRWLDQGTAAIPDRN